MSISEQELRAMVRAAVARQRDGDIDLAPRPQGDVHERSGHSSHHLLKLVGGGDADGRCLIEPAVPCTHCGYCQSLGH